MNKRSSAILNNDPINTVIIEILIFPSERKTALESKARALKGIAQIEMSK